MRFQNDKGEIQISSEVFTTITGAVATSCFGVKGMAARSKKDGLVHLLRSESMAKGVRVIFEEDDTVSIELHIIVDAGVNLTAVSSSIMSEVRYAVGNMTGAKSEQWTSMWTPWRSTERREKRNYGTVSGWKDAGGDARPRVRFPKRGKAEDQ